jgi:hypothetical protein
MGDDFQMSETQKLTISSKEDYALNMMKGLEERAFSLVVGARPDGHGGSILEGPSEAFDALASDVSDEIHYQLSPRSRVKTLEKLYSRLAPDSDGF